MREAFTQRPASLAHTLATHVVNGLKERRSAVVRWFATRPAIPRTFVLAVITVNVLSSLDIALIESLAERVSVPLVLHGSSGVPDVVLRQAVVVGIRKVNVGTALVLLVNVLFAPKKQHAPLGHVPLAPAGGAAAGAPVANSSPFPLTERGWEPSIIR